MILHDWMISMSTLDPTCVLLFEFLRNVYIRNITCWSHKPVIPQFIARNDTKKWLNSTFQHVPSRALARACRGELWWWWCRTVSASARCHVLAVSRATLSTDLAPMSPQRGGALRKIWVPACLVERSKLTLNLAERYQYVSLAAFFLLGSWLLITWHYKNICRYMCSCSRVLLFGWLKFA